MEIINLIWQTQPGDQTTFEIEYTTEVLFKNFNQNRFFDEGNFNIVIDNSVIIYSNNSNEASEDFKKYLDKFVQKGYAFYLLHWSNENLSHNCDYYSKANHVFRPYFDPNIKLDNVTFIPLGFKTGYLSKKIEKVKKEYDFCFIGQPKSDRNELIEVVKKANGFVHATNQWNCPTALDQETCAQIYQKTKFVPCPMGWVNPDSYRIMECLEAGSIPVLKQYNNLEYFKNIWGYTPIPVVNNWEELDKLNSVNEEEYELLQDTVIAWYSKFKNLLSKKIEEQVLNSKKNSKNKKHSSLVHIITPLYRKNNVRILYANILNLTQNFNWYLIEGSNTIGEESIDFLKNDPRVHHYKIDTQYTFGHEQRNYFIENIPCNDNDWCYFLDDDNIITQDFIETITSEKNNNVDIILFSQKKGLTEIPRLYGYEGNLKLGSCDISSFVIRYNTIKKTKIPYENQRNADGHYAEQLSKLENVKIKFYSNIYTRYNSLSLDIS